jgi:hypothetical protein
MLNPHQDELQVESANMLAMQLWLTNASILWFELIVQLNGTLLTFMPFTGVIVFEMSGQFLTSGKLSIA